MDALEALHPRVVDDVGLGDLAGAGQRDAQVAAERIGDEMDVVVGELHRVQTTAAPGREQGARPASSVVYVFPASSSFRAAETDRVISRLSYADLVE